MKEGTKRGISPPPGANRVLIVMKHHRDTLGGCDPRVHRNLCKLASKLVLREPVLRAAGSPSSGPRGTRPPGRGEPVLRAAEERFTKTRLILNLAQAPLSKHPAPSWENNGSRVRLSRPGAESFNTPQVSEPLRNTWYYSFVQMRVLVL